MMVTATELKNRLGQYLEAAQVEPVLIEKSGRTTSVMLSKRRFDELMEQEDHYWDLKARLAEDDGFITDKETEKLFRMHNGTETKNQ